MRAELPPVCRLTAANTQANRPTPNHRQLVELEDRMHQLVARHSMAKLAPALAEPTLKLDEVSFALEQLRFSSSSLVLRLRLRSALTLIWGAAICGRRLSEFEELLIGARAD